MSDYKDEAALGMTNMDKTGIEAYFAPKYGKAIGFGFTADIYRDGQSVLKVFSPAFDKQAIFREAYAAACVEAAGVKSPAVYAVRREGGFYLTETAFVDGADMLSLLFGALAKDDLPEAYDLIRRMAALQADINRTSCPALPSYKLYAASCIRSGKRLTEDIRSRTLRYLEALPDGQGICHGDFHPQNVMVDQEGAMNVIDWVEAGSSHPACDAARTFMNLSCLPPVPVLQRPDLKLAQVYMEAYTEASGLSEEDIRAWLPVHAAINYNNKAPWYCEMIKQYLI